MSFILDQASAVIAAATQRAVALGLAITVVVVDEGGSLKALARMDGAAALTGRIAEAKASGAAEFLRTGEQLSAMIEHREGLFRAASTLSRLPLIPVAGSVIVLRDGVSAGAVAVSGGTPEQDLECAQAGLAAVG